MQIVIIDFPFSNDLLWRNLTGKELGCKDEGRLAASYFPTIPFLGPMWLLCTFWLEELGIRSSLILHRTNHCN
jgi:hypothetical protein